MPKSESSLCSRLGGHRLPRVTRDVSCLPKSKLATNAPSPKSLGRPAPHNILSFQTLGKHVSPVRLSLAAPPRGLTLTGPSRNQGRTALSPCPPSPPPTSDSRLVPASLGPYCHQGCVGEGGGLERRGLSGSFYWHPSRNKTSW